MNRLYSRADGIALLGFGVVMSNMRGTYGGSWSLPSKIIFPQKIKVGSISKIPLYIQTLTTNVIRTH